MTLEQKYIEAIIHHQATASHLIEQAKREPNKQFALQLLEDAESALAAADSVRERGNAYMH